MKKYLVSIVLSLTTIGSIAQAGSNIFAERAELIKKIGTNQSYSMGWYAGSLSNNANDIREINENFLGLSNYLSVKMNSLIVLETIKSDRTVAEEAIKGNFDILYTSSLLGSQLVSKGWKPIVERSENFTPVVLALKTNTSVNSEKDFSKVKVMGSVGTSFTFITYSLSNAKLLDIENLNKNLNFTSKKISQESLVNILNNKQVDAIVVRDVMAEKLMSESDKYKIVYKGQVSPGHMVLLNPKLDANKEEQFRNTFLSLNNLDKNSIALKAIEGHKVGKEVFKSVSNEDIKLANTVFAKTKQIPLVSNTK